MNAWNTSRRGGGSGGTTGATAAQAAIINEVNEYLAKPGQVLVHPAEVLHNGVRYETEADVTLPGTLPVDLSTLANVKVAEGSTQIPPELDSIIAKGGQVLTEGQQVYHNGIPYEAEANVTLPNTLPADLATLANVKKADEEYVDPYAAEENKSFPANHLIQHSSGVYLSSTALTLPATLPADLGTLPNVEPFTFAPSTPRTISSTSSAADRVIKDGETVWIAGDVDFEVTLEAGANYVFAERLLGSTANVTFRPAAVGSTIDGDEGIQIGAGVSSVSFLLDGTNYGINVPTGVAEVTPVIEVAPQATTLPTITPASGPIGTVYTINEGVYTGSPTLSVVLKMNGVDVTAQMAGTSYTSTDDGALSVEVIATNTFGILRKRARSMVLPTAYDLVIDPTGSNAADGSPATPWADFAPLQSLMLAPGADGQNRRILVKTGTYTHADLTYTQVATTQEFRLYFEAGVTVQGVSGTNGSFIDPSSNDTIRLFGDMTGTGAQTSISGFDTGTGNGLGAHLTSQYYAYDFDVDDCQDGASGHNDCFMHVENITTRNCLKSSWAHVQNAVVHHIDCDFQDTAVGVVGHSFNQSTRADECIFIGCMMHADNKLVDLADSTLEDCEIGNITQRVTIYGDYDQAKSAILKRCFVNAYSDGNQEYDLQYCYGFLTVRARDGGKFKGGNCIFFGSATGLNSGLLYAAFDPGSFSDFDLTNSIVANYAGTAIGESFNATMAQYFVDATSTVNNCMFHNNGTDFDADLTTVGADIVTGNLFADPGLTVPTTTNIDDWRLPASSPAYGAGAAGADIGFR